MASTSRLCSDEELQKARADLQNFIARKPMADEFKFIEDEKKENKDKGKKKKKKKKLIRLTPEEVEFLLNFKCPPFPQHTSLAQAEKKDDDKYRDHRATLTAAEVLGRHYEDKIRAAQEKIKHEVETKGYFAYETTDDEEDDNKGATASQQGPRGEHRKHRPGGGIKKLN